MNIQLNFGSFPSFLTKHFAHNRLLHNQGITYLYYQYQHYRILICALKERIKIYYSLLEGNVGVSYL